MFAQFFFKPAEEGKKKWNARLTSKSQMEELFWSGYTPMAVIKLLQH
jgi:hypothetical protein